jgi:hypothetical protein
MLAWDAKHRPGLEQFDRPPTPLDDLTPAQRPGRETR